MRRHDRKLLESSKEVQPPTDTVQPPQEIINLSSPVEKDIVNKSKKGKEKVMEKKEFQLEEQLKFSNHEIFFMKREARKHSVEKIYFENMKEILEEQVDTVSKWTIPVRK